MGFRDQRALTLEEIIAMTANDPKQADILRRLQQSVDTDAQVRSDYQNQLDNAETVTTYGPSGPMQQQQIGTETVYGPAGPMEQPVYADNWGPYGNPNLPGAQSHFDQIYGSGDRGFGWNPRTQEYRTFEHVAPNVLKKGLPIAMAMLGAGALGTGLAGFNANPFAAAAGGAGGGGAGVGTGIWAPGGASAAPMGGVSAAQLGGGGGILSGIGGAASMPGAGTAAGAAGTAAQGGGLLSGLGADNLGLIANALDAVDVTGGTGGSEHTSGPWAQVSPYLQDVYQQAQNIYRQGPGERPYMNLAGDYVRNILGGMN